MEVSAFCTATWQITPSAMAGKPALPPPLLPPQLSVLRMPTCITTTTMVRDILYIMGSVIFQSLSYLTVPALIVSSLSSGSQWFCLAGIVSTVVMSVIASHINNSDAYNVLMQFVYWLTEWGMLGLFQSTFSYTGPCDTIDILWLLKVSTSRSCFRISPPGSG